MPAGLESNGKIHGAFMFSSLHEETLRRTFKQELSRAWSPRLRPSPFLFRHSSPGILLFIVLNLFFYRVAAQTFTVDTPSQAVVCDPLLLSWEGGKAPYSLHILFTEQLEEDHNGLSGTSFNWTVDTPPTQGSTVVLNVTDSTGAFAVSDPFPVVNGTTSCTTGSTSGSGVSPAVVAGAAIAAAAVVGVVTGLLVWYFMRRKYRRQSGGIVGTCGTEGSSALRRFLT